MPEGKSSLDQQPRSSFCRRWIRRIVGVSFVLLLCCVALLFYARSRVTAFTSEKPIELPKRFVSKAEVAKVEKRLEKISNQVAAGSKRSDFLITTEEVNTLVHKEPKLRDKLFIKIVDGMLKADVCFPADLLPGGAGRYFNAEVTVEPAIVDGKLKLNILEALVDGQAVPEMWMSLVRERNFAKPLYNDTEIAQVLANVQSVSVEPEGLRFILRGEANPRQIVLQARANDPRMQVH